MPWSNICLAAVGLSFFWIFAVVTYNTVKMILNEVSKP